MIFNNIISKFQDYTLSQNETVHEYITQNPEIKEVNLNSYLLNDIIKLTEKIIFNKLDSDLLFQKGSWNWGWITLYYSNFYIAQAINRLKGDFFLYVRKDFNRNIIFNKTNYLYDFSRKNGDNSHKREFKKLKENFSYIKRDFNDNENLHQLLTITNSDNKEMFFKYVIDNDIKESEIRNKINYQLKHYKNFILKETEKVKYKEKYLEILESDYELLDIKDNSVFSLLIINHKRICFLSILLSELENVNPSFKLKKERLLKFIDDKINNDYVYINDNIKNLIKRI